MRSFSSRRTSPGRPGEWAGARRWALTEAGPKREHAQRRKPAAETREVIHRRSPLERRGRLAFRAGVLPLGSAEGEGSSVRTLYLGPVRQSGSRKHPLGGSRSAQTRPGEDASQLTVRSTPGDLKLVEV